MDPKHESSPDPDPTFDIKSESGLTDDQARDDAADSASSVGSPTLASAALLAAGGVHRRPTRKSTLTQQQKNQKRQRATQDQLGTLEVEFNGNPTPNASVRERIAQEINMTERSVQIWFQNRRAKIKNMAKKSMENGEECDAIPESMRRYLAMQAMESGSPVTNSDYFLNGVMGPYGNAFLMNAESTNSKVVIYHLTCRSLTIGSWRRIGQTQLDLVVFYCPTKSMVTYYIQAENTGFRIEYPFSSIKSITLEAGDKSTGDASPEHGCIVVELLRPPYFTMDQGSNGWFSCRDFTEEQQASKVLTHRLGGHPKVLGGQLSKLTTLDAYANRFNSEDIKPALASPLPLIDNRPSSQPNHLVHPHSGAFLSHPTFQMGPPPPRGHKRQRSRSVPMGIEFGPRRTGPVPPYLAFHQHQHHHVHHHNAAQSMANQHNQHNQHNQQTNHIFAPVPQYAPQAMSYHPPQFGAVHTPFQVDPSAGFNFDFNTPAPPSTTTGTTGTTPPSSEFEHSFLAPPPFSQEPPLSAPVVQQPFTAHFLSPVTGSPNVNDHSPSPLSGLGHPLQHPSHLSPHVSPPGMVPNPLFRSASADPRAPVSNPDSYYNDFFDFNAGSFTNGRVNGYDEPSMAGAFDDTINWPSENPSTLDALLVDDPLLDPTSKQPLTLPFRLSFPDQPKGVLPPSTPPPVETYEFADLVTLEPLTPEQIGIAR